jgi:hypothetical protein
MHEALLLPDLEDQDGAPFWAATARGELSVQACGDCDRLRFPPRPMCPHCQSVATEWRAVSGRGAIWSFVVVHPPLLPAYAALAPYPVVVVALAEDASLRMVGNVVAGAGAPINSVPPQTLEIGQAVQVVFAAVGGVHLPRWVRV